MTTMPKGINWNEQFYKLLRLSLGLTQEFPVDVDADGWRRLYQTAIRQSLVGVCYQGVCLLPEGSKPPVEIAMQWASEAESIKGMNELLYQEAARLTREFAEKRRKTAIQKGQANARLYPDKYARQPGDIDIWVEGGRERVLELLPNHPKASYHHVTGKKLLYNVNLSAPFVTMTYGADCICGRLLVPARKTGATRWLFFIVCSSCSSLCHIPLLSL